VKETGISKRCTGVISERDGRYFRFASEKLLNSPEARRLEIAAARAKRSAMDDAMTESQRIVAIQRLQRASAEKLLAEGMDVLAVSNITSLGIGELGQTLHRINMARQKQRRDAHG
jgi:hypothetical protein